MRVRILIGMAVLFFGITQIPTDAEARWVCRAYSSTGSYGWGAHNYSEGYARRRALAECAVRTPRGYTCYLRSCNLS